MTENMQARRTQSRQMVIVRYCLKYFITAAIKFQQEFNTFLLKNNVSIKKSTDYLI